MCISLQSNWSRLSALFSPFVSNSGGVGFFLSLEFSLISLPSLEQSSSCHFFSISSCCSLTCFCNDFFHLGKVTSPRVFCYCLSRVSRSSLKPFFPLYRQLGLFSPLMVSFPSVSGIRYLFRFGAEFLLSHPVLSPMHVRGELTIFFPQ